MRRTKRGDLGAAALELAVIAPVFLILLCLVVGFGRVLHGRQVVEQAAAAGARTASLSATPEEAARSGSAAARGILDEAGISCQEYRIDILTINFRAGGEVSAAVRCSAKLSDLALAGLPGSVGLTATTRIPLDLYRDFGS